MKTPEEILEVHYKNYKKRIAYEEKVLAAMKEFGRQAWIACDLNWNSKRADIFAFEIEEAQKSNERYEHWMRDLYLNQIAKESQERGEYEVEPEECRHDHAYHFHENGPRYCPDCDKYIE